MLFERKEIPDMLHPTLAKPAVCRTEDQWRSAINRNRAIAAVSDLGGAIQIYKGRYFWPMQPNHPGNDIDIETIAHALAVMPRWGGQTALIGSSEDGDPLRYSVAQHSVHVADICVLNRRKLLPGWDWDKMPSPAALALLHDAPEGYGFADLVRPVKYSVEGYKENENALMHQIAIDLDVPVNLGISQVVKMVDDMMVFLERDEMMGPPVVPYTNEASHPGITIHDVVPDFYVWSAKEAKDKFLRRWEMIQANDGEYEPLEYANRGYRL